jgi:DnaJ-class molecular chaperone
MAAGADHYAILGLAPSASPAEIRRAFRRLALEYHPDRAGPDSTPIFQRIADAYAVLAHPNARAAYDALRDVPLGDRPGDNGGSHGGHRPWMGAAGLRARLRAEGRLLVRLSRPLPDLVAADLAFQNPDGRIDLFLTPSEAAWGGVALIDLSLSVPCSTCGGIARPGGFWCLRCAQTGRVMDMVTIYCAIPRRIVDGSVVTISAADAGGAAPPPIRVRVRG